MTKNIFNHHTLWQTTFKIECCLLSSFFSSQKICQCTAYGISISNTSAALFLFCMSPFLILAWCYWEEWVFLQRLMNVLWLYIHAGSIQIMHFSVHAKICTCSWNSDTSRSQHLFTEVAIGIHLSVNQYANICNCSERSSSRFDENHLLFTVRILKWLTGPLSQPLWKLTVYFFT